MATMSVHSYSYRNSPETISLMSVASSWSGPTGVYDFLSDDNSSKWIGLLQPGLSKIQKQVQPRLEINEDALAYLEGMIFRLLAQMCAAQPHTLPDVESYVQKNFATPIDSWALSDAKMLMERTQKKKVYFVFPVDKMFPLLQKEVFGYKIELNLVQFIMAILDYVSADILKLAGNFVKNTRRAAVYIRANDIRVSMSADRALQALFQPLQGQREPVETHPLQPLNERKSLSYDDILREIVDDEKQYVRHLNLILKVFMEPFLNEFPDDEVQQIVSNLQELHEISAQLVASLEESIEMSGEEGEGPQAGFIFEETAETCELEAYIRYAENYMMAKTRLEEMIDHPNVVEYFSTPQRTGHLREAMKYILPKSLDEPCYHCFHYFDAIESLSQTSPDPEDQEALESAISGMLGIKREMENVCSRFLKKRSREETGMFVGKRQGYQVMSKKLTMIQQKIDQWEGPDILNCCTEFIMEGALGVMKEGSRRSRDKNDRHVFLLDGLMICCKTRSKSGMGDSQYRLKEKISMRKVKLTDLEDTDELKYAFSLQDQYQPGLIFFAISKIEKNDWMALLTHLVTRSTFDRLLDIKLREEENTIPPLRPSPQYIFAEEDSTDNILFDDKDGSSVGSGALIKAGTIYKLVERLTFHEYADPTFVRTFLMTYRSFCHPGELLDLLISRYHIPNPTEQDDIDSRRDPLMMKAVKRFRDNYISPIQLRVLNVLRHWVEFHYYDFEREPQLLEKLRNFVDGVKSKKLQKWVSSIHRSLQKHAEEEKAEPKPVFEKEPEPLEWHIATSGDITKYGLLSLHPVEIARQLTLIQYKYFKAIHPSELVDASWMKEQKKEQASPNLLRLNRFETTVSNWLSEEIVFTEYPEERIALVSRLVDIMEALMNLNNFAGMFVINAALESASVFRLKHTIKTVQKKHPRLEEMKKIASSERGFKQYKEKLRNVHPPCVPFLGMYMSWIVFIKDGNEDKIQGMPDDFINFKKRRKIADVLQEIQQFQNTPYCLIPEISIQKYILSQDPVGELSANLWEDKLFEQSRLIEPKDGPLKIGSRRFQESELQPPKDTKTGTLNVFKKYKHHTLPHPIMTDHHSQLLVEGAEYSPRSGSSPSSPRDILNPTNGIPSPHGRKFSETVPPRRPPKPANLMPQSPSSLPSNGSLTRMSASSPVLTSSTSSDEPPPVPERSPPPIPPKPPSSNALPLPPKQVPSQRKILNNGPPLPPREAPPSLKSPPTVTPPINDGPPLPPKYEGTSQRPSSESPIRNSGPALPREYTPSRNPPIKRDSKPYLSPPPPVPPRGS